jgi:anti-sigma B factor antagonist
VPSVSIEVESSVRGTTRVVVVRGEVDLSSVEKVRRSLDRALAASPETVVLDLSAVTFCDSSGARVVVGAHRRAIEQGCHLVVVRPDGHAWRTFEICQLDRWLHFVAADDRPAAPVTLLGENGAGRSEPKRLHSRTESIDFRPVDDGAVDNSPAAREYPFPTSPPVPM